MAEDDAVLYPLVKRATDLTVAVLLLVVLSPLVAVVLFVIAIGMLLRPQDRGSLLYREPRISRGREIAILKFRVVREDVIERMRREGAPQLRPYEADLANLTWAGRTVVKRWYLDEIPQLVNILRGDMSLVGPRPWPRTMVEEQATRGLTYRSHVAAGWTGLAQLNKGSSRIGRLADVETLDLQYVGTLRAGGAWRLWRTDMTILGRTVKTLAAGKGLSD